jgi:hypothetical protein
MITETQVYELCRGLGMHRLPGLKHTFMSRCRAMLSVRFDINGALVSFRFFAHPDATGAEQFQVEADELRSIDDMRAIISTELARLARERNLRRRIQSIRRSRLGHASRIRPAPHVFA